MSKPTEQDIVTTPYGRPGDWMAGYHTGIDYHATVGTKVHATRRGKVVAAGSSHYGDAYGTHVVIRSWHKFGFREHLYAHLSHVQVRLGQKVYAGQQIGLSGDTGRTFGAHLHYEERVSPFGYWDHVKPVLPDWWPATKAGRKKVFARITGKK